MSTKVRSLVTGAGGFIGHHLVSFLRTQGHWVRGVDLKHPDFCGSDANEYELLDLRSSEDCIRATAEIDEIYALAADVGGTGCGTPDHLLCAGSVNVSDDGHPVEAMTVYFLADLGDTGSGSTPTMTSANKASRKL